MILIPSFNQLSNEKRLIPIPYTCTIVHICKAWRQSEIIIEIYTNLTLPPSNSETTLEQTYLRAHALFLTVLLC